jgi:hypothetical protein
MRGFSLAQPLATVAAAWNSIVASELQKSLKDATSGVS